MESHGSVFPDFRRFLPIKDACFIMEQIFTNLFQSGKNFIDQKLTIRKKALHLEDRFMPDK